MRGLSPPEPAEMLTLTLSAPPWPENRARKKRRREECKYFTEIRVDQFSQTVLANKRRRVRAGGREKTKTKNNSCMDDTVAFCGRVSLPDDSLKSIQENS